MLYFDFLEWFSNLTNLRQINVERKFRLGSPCQSRQKVKPDFVHKRQYYFYVALYDRQNPSDRSYYTKFRINLRLQIFQSSSCFSYDFISPLFTSRSLGLSRFTRTAESGITCEVGLLFIVKDKKTKSRSLLLRRDTVVSPRYPKRKAV